MTDGTGTTTYTYDQAGRTTRVADGGGWAVDYTYDRAGNITNLAYQGLNVARAFDDANRLTAVDDGYGYITRFAYDPDGNVVRTDYHNGVVGTSTFDPTGRETDIAYTLGSTTLGRYTYIRDLNGNVTGASDQTVTGTAPHAYTYTPVDQLASADGGTYGYDQAGNRTSAPGGVSFTYDAADQLTAMTTSGPLGPQTTTYSYDAQGNRTAAAGPLATTTYRWDQANRLTHVGPAVRFAYNGDGLRLRKIVGAVAWRYQWDTVSADVPVLLSDTDRVYIYGPGGRIIEQLDLADLRVHYLHRDQIGNIRLATNDVGAPAGTADYSPFGTPTSGSTVGATTPFGFAGEYTDTETGLVYLRARYYDPTTGQFISRDPLEQTTGDAYAYGENNPLNVTDPTGECPFCVIAAGALLGAALDLGVQAGTNMLQGCGAFDNINWWSVGLSGVLGAATGGAGSAAKAGASGVTKTLSGLAAGRSTGVRVVGSADELDGLFARLARGGSQVESNYPGKLVRLPDGTTVGLRGASRSGGPTIDVRLPNGQTIKVHVDPWPPAG